VGSLGPASISPCQDSSGKRHLRVVKVELLIFGRALRFVGGGYGLHCGQPAISGSEHIAGCIVHPQRPPLIFSDRGAGHRPAQPRLPS
jgi:hypothetical protein